MSKRLREWRLSRARAARAEKPAAPALPTNAPDPATAPPAPDPELSEKFAKKAHDLDAVRKSVEDAAAVSAGFWLSYLFVLFYIAIAAGAVTHKDLLLENPVKLPFLNVELPLVAFFVLAPILFIVSHAYTLVHYVMLAAKAGVFNNELGKHLGDAPEKSEGLRQQLSSNVFVQLCAGPSDIRKGGLGWLLKAVAWFSLVIGPVLLLLLIQAQFLPYHLEWVTWVQRVAILVDVILLWLLWPAVLNGRSKLMWCLERRGKGWPGVLALTGRYIAGLTACLIPICLAFTAATFPGERLNEHVGKKQWIPLNLAAIGLSASDSDEKPKRTSFHDLLFNGDVDPVTRRRKSLFSNTLVLTAFDALDAKAIDDQKKLDWTKHTLVLRGRHLEKAVFDFTDLRKADLEGSQLQDASFFYAQLQGASFRAAQLQGAGLVSAKLQGAVLDGAQLQGAVLDYAQLQGAKLFSAQLQGASLKGAQLQGAYLIGTVLRGTVLDYAQFLGAVLEYAQLQGANLKGVQLQGADFLGTKLTGMNMANAALWRTNFEGASLTAVFEDGLSEKPISKDVFARLRSDVTEEVPSVTSLEYALKRIEKLNPDIFGPDASEQETLEKGRGDETAYKKSLADELKSLACSGNESAPYIVRGLIANDRIKDTGAQAHDLVEAIVKPEDAKDCPVSAALTEADKAALTKIAKEASGAH